MYSKISTWKQYASKNVLSHPTFTPSYLLLMEKKKHKYGSAKS
jgi:hypothetical protein